MRRTARRTRPKKNRNTHVTTMRLPRDLMQEASQRAEQLEMSRTQYINHLIRRDLGYDSAIRAPGPADVFG